MTIEERIKKRLEKEGLTVKEGMFVYKALFRAVKDEMTNIANMGDMEKYMYIILLGNMGEFYSRKFNNEKRRKQYKENRKINEREQLI